MMKSKEWTSRKVVVVGAGAVGSTFAYALAQSGIADEIVLVDRNHDLAAGQALDLAHGLPFFPTVQIRAGQIEDYGDAQIIVVTAGAKQEPGQTRIALLQRNAAIVESIMTDVVAQNSSAVVVMVSNPVDVLTHVALKKSGWPRQRILGSGTVLDSSRFRYLLSQCSEVDVHNVHAYILGEHGDSELAAWSMTHIAGVSIDEYCKRRGCCANWEAEREIMAEEVKNSAYHIINYKGATCYAVGMALVLIARAILRNQRSVLTVSTLLEGEYGLSDVCLSVPCLVTQEGIEGIIEGTLAPAEQEALERSAALLKQALAELG